MTEITSFWKNKNFQNLTNVVTQKKSLMLLMGHGIVLQEQEQSKNKGTAASDKEKVDGFIKELEEFDVNKFDDYKLKTYRLFSLLGDAGKLKICEWFIDHVDFYKKVFSEKWGSVSSHVDKDNC